MSEEYEAFVKQQIIEIQKRYYLEVEPWLNKLCQLEAMKPPKPFIVELSPEQIVAFREAHPHLFKPENKAEDLDLHRPTNGT